MSDTRTRTRRVRVRATMHDMLCAGLFKHICAWHSIGMHVCNQKSDTSKDTTAAGASCSVGNLSVWHVQLSPFCDCHTTLSVKEGTWPKRVLLHGVVLALRDGGFSASTS